MENVKSFINENGKLITGFLAVLIIFGGIAAVNNTENWWIIPVGILVIGILAIVFMNARFIIKLLIAIFTTSLLSGYAFQIGTNLNNNDTGDTGAFWMGLMWINFFAFISITYAKESNQSRWTSIIITQVLSFLYFYVLILTFNFTITMIVGEILTLTTFILFYYFPLKNILNNNSMPKQELLRKFINQVDKETNLLNWNYKILEKNKSVLTWGKYKNKEIAIVIIPVKMDQKFGLIGKKKQQLSYKGKPINDWLNNLIYKSIPNWKLRGVTPLPVLCDIDSKNGKDIKMIGVKIIDRKEPYPFIISPMKTNFIKETIKEYGNIAPELTKNQLKALDELK